MNAKEILTNKQNFAVIGISPNKDKYSYQIYQRLKKLGKNVYGVSPLYQEIDNDIIYPDLLNINKPIDVAVFIVNSKIGVKYIEECKKLNINHIWLQPGTYDDNLISIIEKDNLNYYLNCVLVESNDMFI